MRQQQATALVLTLALAAFFLASCEGRIPESVEGWRETAVTSSGESVCQYSVELKGGQSWSGTAVTQEGNIVWVQGLLAGEDGVSRGVNPDLVPLSGICPPIKAFQLVSFKKDGTQELIKFKGECMSTSVAHASLARFRCYRDREHR